MHFHFVVLLEDVTTGKLGESTYYPVDRDVLDPYHFLAGQLCSRLARHAKEEAIGKWHHGF